MKLLPIFLFTFIIAFFGSAQTGMKLKNRTLELILSMNGDRLKIVSIETTQKEVIDMSKVHSDDLKEYIHSDQAFESKPIFNAYTDNSQVENNKKKYTVKSITEEDYMSRGIFYSGTKLYTLTFPNVINGSILTSITTIEYNEPRLIPAFFFDDWLACDHAEFIVRVGEGIDLGYLNFNHTDALPISFETEVIDGETIYRWTADNTVSRTYEADSRGSACEAPHTIVHIKSFSKSGERIENILRDKNDLFTWYNSLIEDQQLGDHQLAILDSIKLVSPTKNELAENIFNWVQHNIKYIAYEDGLGGFKPRSPESVLHNRYGDCKDMALLTKTMMNAVNLECYVAWVGTRSKCYTYDNCPTPMVDNHMIAAYRDGENLIFLDPTSSYSVFGRPSSFIQGKEAMVRTSAGTFEIIIVPTVDSKENLDHTIITAQIKETNLIGNGANQLNGFGKETYENAYDNRLDAGKEQLFTDFIALGNEGILIENLVQVNLNSNKGSINSTFDFSLKNHLRRFKNEMYINPFIKEVISFDLEGRELLLDLDYKSMTAVEVSIEIPAGSKLSVPFESETISESGLALTIKTSVIGNLFTLYYSFSCDRLEIDPTEFEAIRSVLKKMNKKLNQQITLTNEI